MAAPGHTCSHGCAVATSSRRDERHPSRPEGGGVADLGTALVTALDDEAEDEEEGCHSWLHPALDMRVWRGVSDEQEDGRCGTSCAKDRGGDDE